MIFKNRYFTFQNVVSATKLWEKIYDRKHDPWILGRSLSYSIGTHGNPRENTGGLLLPQVSVALCVPVGDVIRRCLVVFAWFCVSEFQIVLSAFFFYVFSNFCVVFHVIFHVSFVFCLNCSMTCRWVSFWACFCRMMAGRPLVVKKCSIRCCWRMTSFC